MALSDHDFKLKMKVSALFRQLGYVVFNEVDLCAYVYQEKYARKQITDFDVLGILFEADLGSWVAVGECKSVKEHAMERLLKLSGLRNYFNANKAYFVQKQMDANTREVGKSFGIWCLNEDNLGSLMKSVGISDADVETETNIYTAKVSLSEVQKNDFNTQFKYLKYDYWTLPDHRNIINLIELFRELGQSDKQANDAYILLAHQLTTNFALSILRLTGQLIRQNIDNFPDGLLTALLGGSRERRDREALYDTVSKMISKVELSLKPIYFEALAEIVNRYKISAAHSYQVASCLDDMTRQIIFPDCESSDPITNKFSDITIKLAQDAIYFVTKLSGISEKVFSRSLE